jgi:hypothetical protein
VHVSKNLSARKSFPQPQPRERGQKERPPARGREPLPCSGVLRLVTEPLYETVTLPKLDVMTIDVLLGVFFGTFIILAHKLYCPDEMTVCADDVRPILCHGPLVTTGSQIRNTEITMASVHFYTQATVAPYKLEIRSL